VNFLSALAAQAQKVMRASDDLAAVQDVNHATTMVAIDRLSAAVDTAMDGFKAIERDAAVKRVRAQAANRARINGVDERAAADAAEGFLNGGESHENAVKFAAGEYRKSA
jgi:hypothetical protein